MIEMETEIRHGCQTVAEAIAIVKEQARVNQGEYRTDKKHIATFIECLENNLVNKQMSYQQDKIHGIFWDTTIKMYTADKDSVTKAEVITLALFTAIALNQHANHQKRTENEKRLATVLERIDKLDRQVSQDLEKCPDG